MMKMKAVRNVRTKLSENYKEIKKNDENGTKTAMIKDDGNEKWEIRR